MSKGIVYVLVNQAMEGYIKIGKTNDLYKRLKSLDNTSLPLPFECHYAAEVANMDMVERTLHDVFGDHRVRKNREFFKVAPERVVAALKLAPHDVISIHPDYDDKIDEQAVRTAKERRSVFNFNMVEIAPDTELIFSRNRQYTCIVADNRNVVFQGDVMSLSHAALKALALEGIHWQSAQGANYWQLDDETLVERRERYENLEMESE